MSKSNVENLESQKLNLDENISYLKESNATLQDSIHTRDKQIKHINANTKQLIEK